MLRNVSKWITLGCAALTLVLIFLVQTPRKLIHAQGNVSTCPVTLPQVSVTDGVEDGLVGIGANEYERLTQLNPPLYDPTGFTGGLYPGGANVPPAGRLNTALSIARTIQPLDTHGNPSADGSILLLSIGMSNTSQEFMEFIREAQNDARMNPAIKLINGARSGQETSRWVDDSYNNWTRVENDVTELGYDPRQVQVAWVKLANKEPLPQFPAEPERLRTGLESVARNLKQYFPNIKIAYFSPRARSYLYFDSTTPGELAAFETGFAIKWMIERQMNGVQELTFEGSQANVPFLTWGPYFWRDAWPPQYLEDDCIHPSSQGEKNIAEILMDFFLTDPTAVEWFAKEDQGAVPLPGDFTNDNEVTINDIRHVISYFGSLFSVFEYNLAAAYYGQTQ